MSGGSWYGAYDNIGEIADRLLRSKCPYRVAFGKLMSSAAAAIYDIDMVDSGDFSHGSEIEAIRKVLGVASENAGLSVAADQAQSALESISTVLKQLQSVKAEAESK